MMTAIKNSRKRPTIIFFVVIFFGTAVILFSLFGSWGVPKRAVIEVDFERGMVEYVPNDPVARVVLSRRPVLREVVEALLRASEDERVVGLIARVGEANLKLAQIQEVRDAVIAFRKTGKPAIAYAETFGETGPGNGSYYLATAFDEIYMQPSGDVGLTGLIFERSFYKGALDKLGVIPRIGQRYEYKNAANIFTERKFTRPHREAVQRVMESQFGQIVRGIAEARNIPAERVRSLINSGPFLGNDAVEAKLVDGLAYRDEAYARIKDKAGKGAAILSLSKYHERAGSPYRKGKTIALIYGAGGVQRGKSGYHPATGELTMGSDTVAAAFRQAAADKKVKAILFRVDSPGGSYVASDTVWREVVLARKAGKPVIVSMGSVAGSGGYFVSMAADKIVAQPGTITGSIGVLGGKMVMTGLWNKLGVTWDEVHTGANADAWTVNKDFSPEQWARVQQWLDRIYEDFTGKVSEGRGLPLEKVLLIAKGRIWTGEDAKARGLVDELGGFTRALQLAKKAAGIPDDATVRIKVYPGTASLLQMLLGKERERSEGTAVEALSDLLEDMQPYVRMAEIAGIIGEQGVLTMPELPEE